MCNCGSNNSNSSNRLNVTQDKSGSGIQLFEIGPFRATSSVRPPRNTRSVMHHSSKIEPVVASEPTEEMEPTVATESTEETETTTETINEQEV